MPVRAKIKYFLKLSENPSNSAVFCLKVFRSLYDLSNKYENILVLNSCLRDDGFGYKKAALKLAYRFLCYPGWVNERVLKSFSQVMQTDGGKRRETLLYEMTYVTQRRKEKGFGTLQKILY